MVVLTYASCLLFVFRNKKSCEKNKNVHTVLEKIMEEWYYIVEGYYIADLWIFNI